MKSKVDNVDLMILSELREDCKRPMRELANKLRMHPNTLLQRIKRLEKAKIIRKYHADINYKALGYDIHVVVMIRIKKGGLENPNLLKNVAAMPEVVSLYASTGVSDVIAIIKAKNRDHLLNILKNVQSEKDVLRTTSYLILVTYKEAYEFNPLSPVVRKA